MSKRSGKAAPPAKPHPSAAPQRVPQRTQEVEAEEHDQRELVERDSSTVRKSSNARGDQAKRAKK